MRGHMDFLASDALNGRGSGTRDEWIAATYMGSQMRRWGIEPLGDNGGYVQAVELSRLEAASAPVLTIDGRRFTHGKEMLVQSVGAPGGTGVPGSAGVSGSAGVPGSVVGVPGSAGVPAGVLVRVSGPLQKFQAGGSARAGAVLLLPEGVPAPPASLAGAVVVLSPETPAVRSRWDAVATRAPGSPARMVALPEAAGAARPTRITLDKAAHAVLSAAAEGTAVTLEAELKTITAYTWNAIGQLKGSDPAAAADVILLTAHLDHLGARGTGPDPIYNGADDDASGSVAVLELAETLARGPRPKRTVMFAWFGSEEAGGYGARLFVERPPVPLERIVANLEFEMIGRADAAVAPHTLWLTGYERTNLGPELAKRGAKIVADPHPEQNFFMRSDNIQLARAGVIAQTVSSFGLHKEYHQPSDEIRFIDFAHMTDAIRSMIEPVRWLANNSFKPEWLPGKRP